MTQVVMQPKDYVKLFIKEFIQEGKDSNIPLSDTYVLYFEFMKQRFPDQKPITEVLYHRITTDYFFKKPGAKNTKAVSLEELQKDLARRQTAINRDSELLRRIIKNRNELIYSQQTSSDRLIEF